MAIREYLIQTLIKTRYFEIMVVMIGKCIRRFTKPGKPSSNFLLFFGCWVEVMPLSLAACR